MLLVCWGQIITLLWHQGHQTLCSDWSFIPHKYLIMRERYYRWYTPYLSREMEMLVFGHGGHPIILFPTTKGRYYQNKDFGLIESVRGYVEAGLISIYCPDSVDASSWYNWSIHPADRVRTHAAYERMILNEVVNKARYDTWKSKVIFAGCSFGGFHALNMGLRNPDVTSNILSMSGAPDVRMFMDGYHNEDFYFHNPIDFVGGLQYGYALDAIRRTGIVLGVAEHDSLRGMNENFSHILRSKGIDHWYDFHPIASHDWPTWRYQFPRYIHQLVS